MLVTVILITAGVLALVLAEYLERCRMRNLRKQVEEHLKELTGEK